MILRDGMIYYWRMYTVLTGEDHEWHSQHFQLQVELRDDHVGQYTPVVWGVGDLNVLTLKALFEMPLLLACFPFFSQLVFFMD